MTYDKAVEYINEIPKFTKKNTPEHTKEFLKRLGNPQDSLKVIHVAGTNGKGSVSSYLDAMLRAQGKTVGLALSPHLVKMNERIVINHQMVDDDTFLNVFEQVKEKVEGMVEDGLPHPTFFEFLFGMVLTAFAQAKVEYAVLETGLGGRLDATNCVEHPICSVITSIGMDHMQYLGNTLEEIATEKAGILKNDVPAFYIEGQKESNQVIEKRAKELGIPCKKVSKNAFEILENDEKYIAFSCANAYYGDVTWKLNNTGRYQAENAMLALEVMRYLFGAKGELQKWQETLRACKVGGRMEEVLPHIYIDGAHNISAIERFVESVPKDTTGIGILFSVVEDKDYEEMIACLCQQVDADFFVITHIADKRAADTEKLAEIFRQYTEKPVLVQDSLKDAWNYVTSNQKDRTIYCLGSLYLVGMVKALIEEESNARF